MAILMGWAMRLYGNSSTKTVPLWRNDSVVVVMSVSSNKDYGVPEKGWFYVSVVLFVLKMGVLQILNTCSSLKSFVLLKDSETGWPHAYRFIVQEAYECCQIDSLQRFYRHQRNHRDHLSVNSRGRCLFQIPTLWQVCWYASVHNERFCPIMAPFVSAQCHPDHIVRRPYTRTGLNARPLPAHMPIMSEQSGLYSQG